MRPTVVAHGWNIDNGPLPLEAWAGTLLGPEGSAASAELLRPPAFGPAAWCGAHPRRNGHGRHLRVVAVVQAAIPVRVFPPVA